MKLNLLATLLALPAFAAAACDVDSTGEFKIQADGNQFRTCAWVAEDTEARCLYGEVQWQCETLCGCDDAVLAAAVGDADGETDTINETLIVSLSLLGAAVLIAAAAFMTMAIRKKKSLNDNKVVLSMMSEKDIESHRIDMVNSHVDSVATEDVQRTGSLVSCCAPC
jgi:hypothetical protein